MSRADERREPISRLDGVDQAGVPVTFGLDSIAQLFRLDGDAPAVDPLLGVDVGGVTLVRLIGEGGMGRVYEAIQDRPRRPVAVKIMRPGFASRETYRRFLREAEILGRLRHPGVAQIFAAGVCPIAGSQVPFFVMEFMPNALPITEYAAVHALPIDERMKLMWAVCDAVAHGHDQGVVHRDLKPGNILVDAVGRPKIIDFGVARVDDGAAPMMTALTDAGHMIGTLQYMSPEQITGASGAIDCRADVYSLGVVLHELLTGRPPYDVRRHAMYEAVRVIMEHVPESPSVRDPRLGRGVAEIIVRCLQKDRSRRYPSARELRDSLDHCLAGAPAHFLRTAAISGRRRTWLVAACALAAAFWVAMPAMGRRSAALSVGKKSERHDRVDVFPADRSDKAAREAPPSSDATLSVEERDGGLHLLAPEVLSAGQAEVLVERGRPLDLRSITKLDAEVAGVLARTPGRLALNGLQQLSAESARQLARQRGTLCLDAIRALDAETARALSGHPGWLNLGGLETLPDDALAALTTHSGGLTISLPGPLTRHRAAVIADHVGDLYLLGVESVDGPSAEVLARHEGPVALDAKRLSADAQAVLDRHTHISRFFNR